MVTLARPAAGDPPPRRTPPPGPPFTFTDARGRPWHVAVTHAVLEQVRDRFGLDLAAVVVSGGNPVEALATPAELLWEVLYVILGRQARDRGIGPDEFIPQLLTRSPDRALRLSEREAEAVLERVYFDAGRALCRALAVRYPNTVFSRALAMDDDRRAGQAETPDLPG